MLNSGMTWQVPIREFVMGDVKLRRRGRFHMCISLGKWPVKLFCDKSNLDKEERLKIDEGMVPVKKLFCNHNSSNSSRFPSSSGISPKIHE